MITLFLQTKPSRVARWLGAALSVLAAATLAGCRTPGPAPTFNLSEPGWQVRQGQALWQARPGFPELAGEVMAAWNTDGRGFVQFTKTPFTLVNAWSSSTGWQIEFPPERRSYAGGGLPSGRFGWLHLERALAGLPLAADWELTNQADGGLSLKNRRTGEHIAAHFSP